MDGATAVLKEKLNRLLKEAAQVSVDLGRADGTITGVPHYFVIEARAHELGQQLSREISSDCHALIRGWGRIYLASGLTSTRFTR